MRIEDLKQVQNQRPFIPFSIVPAGGEPIPIRHPDALAWDEQNPRLVVAMSGRQLHRLDPMLISVVVEERAAGQVGNRSVEGG
jgi:hypothetical protein